MSDDYKYTPYQVTYEDQPTIPNVEKFWHDPSAPYSGIWKYTNAYGGYSGDYNTDTTNTRAWKIDPGLQNAVRYRAPYMIGNEGMTLEPGAYEIDWSKLPKGSTSYGTNITPAFMNEEDYNLFKTNPVQWSKTRSNSNNPYLRPQYDPNYGWVVHSGEATRLAEERQNRRPMTKFSNFFVNTALPALASMTMGGLGFPSMALSGISAARSIGQGQKPLSVLGNAALSYGLGQLGGSLAGGAGRMVGGGLPKLFNLFNSPGNTRMNMGYRPTIPAPNWYNNLRG